LLKRVVVLGKRKRRISKEREEATREYED